MDAYAVVAQVVIAMSIAIVWVGRFENIVQEFKHYGLPDVVRTAQGAHVRVRHPGHTFVPPHVLLLLSLFVAEAHLGTFTQ